MEGRPKVNGLIRRRLWRECSSVRAGRPLCQVDASLNEAAAQQAEANLASAEASAQAADEKAKRFEPLARMQAIAEQDYTDALAAARAARAAEAQNRAALAHARIKLRYTTIGHPIGRRLGQTGRLSCREQSGQYV